MHPPDGTYDVPADYKSVGIFMLIAGITNIMACLGFVIAWIASLFMFFMACFWIVFAVAAVFEIVVGAAIMQGQYKPNAKTISILGLVCAILCFNIIGIIMEILALTNLGKPQVANWMALQYE